jgi:hypothetical protein
MVQLCILLGTGFSFAVSEIHVHLNISNLDMICRQKDAIGSELLDFWTLCIIRYSKN